MAGKYAKILRSITSDLDFRSVPPMGKLVYLWIVAQPKLSPCGVLDFIPGRLANELGIPLDQLLAIVSDLVDDGYLLADHETCEIAVRTYVRHDVQESNSNMLKAAYNALDQISSPRLRGELLAAMERGGVPTDPRPPERRSNAVTNTVRTPFEHPSGGPSDSVRTSLYLIPQPKTSTAAGDCAVSAEIGGSVEPFAEAREIAAAAAAAIRLIAERRLVEEVSARKAQGMPPIRIPSKYLDAIVAPLMADRVDDAAQLLFDNPALTVEELAAAIEAPDIADVPWSPDPECSLCEGHPWIVGDDGIAHRCSACFPAPAQETRT